MLSLAIATGGVPGAFVTTAMCGRQAGLPAGYHQRQSSPFYIILYYLLAAIVLHVTNDLYFCINASFAVDAARYR